MISEYRAKSLENNNWIYGHYTKDQHGNSLIVDVSGDKKQKTYPFNKVEPNTVGQFVGLEDSDGVKVFGGDWIEFTYWWFDGHGEAESMLSGYLRYNKECLSWELVGIRNKDWLRHVGGDSNNDPDATPFAFFNFSEADFRVKGNIYDNPELKDLITTTAEEETEEVICGECLKRVDQSELDMFGGLCEDCTHQE